MHSGIARHGPCARGGGGGASGDCGHTGVTAETRHIAKPESRWYIVVPSLLWDRAKKFRWDVHISLFGADPTGYRARSSAGEHYLDMVGVTGSIPVAPTISFNGLAGISDFLVGSSARRRQISEQSIERCPCRAHVVRRDMGIALRRSIFLTMAQESGDLPISIRPGLRADLFFAHGRPEMTPQRQFRRAYHPAQSWLR
jgi:hypothetical protein